MRVIRRRRRPAARVGLVLLDWSVRESFHLLHYLREQTAGRDAFEVTLVEYYDRVSPAAKQFEDQLDTWVLLDMPAELYYHKHLMYNVGIAATEAEVLVVCDSDAMVRPTFIASVLDAFDEDPGTVLHLDQFRSMRRDLYPFCYPSFEEVTGPGCVNWADGLTAGLRDAADPLHSRNYGACMAARRDDLLEVGGADEHPDFVGHVCGPYDMTFRLANAGRRERWHQEEFLYHTWHPGADGIDNYLGPHDGMNMSSTSLEALITGRTMPYVMNPGIARLRQDPGLTLEDLEPDLVHPEVAAGWREADLVRWSRGGARFEAVGFRRLYKGFEIRAEAGPGAFTARLRLDPREVDGEARPCAPTQPLLLAAPTFPAALGAVDQETGGTMDLVEGLAGAFFLAWGLVVELPARARRALARRRGASREVPGAPSTAANAAPDAGVRASGADPRPLGRVRRWASFAKRGYARVQRILGRHAFEWGNLWALLVNLRLAPRAATVAVDGRGPWVLAQLGRGLGLLPATRWRACRDQADLEGALAGADQPLVVDRNLFLKHQARLVPEVRAGKVVLP